MSTRGIGASESSSLSSSVVAKKGSSYTNHSDAPPLPRPKRKAPFNLHAKVAVRLCTGCHREEAEHVHPVLGVQICGMCNKRYKDALGLARSSAGAKCKVEHITRCLWCSRIDDVNLFLCDGCQFAFCKEVVTAAQFYST